MVETNEDEYFVICFPVLLNLGQNYVVLSPFKILSCFEFFICIIFIMYLDIVYV